MTLLEKVVFSLLLIVMLVGIYIDYTDPIYFESTYTKEDGLFENTTALMLFLGGILMLYRFMKLGKNRNGWFKLTTMGVALAFLFVAGEEISWGQRIFNVESSDFFIENNVQDETNFHNLEVGGVKLNKLIFGQLLTAVILTYLIIFPILYRRSEKAKSLFKLFSVPIPRIHHAVAYLVCMALLLLISSGKKWELLELTTSFVFFFILWRPLNNIYEHSKE